MQEQIIIKLPHQPTNEIIKLAIIFFAMMVVIFLKLYLLSLSLIKKDSQ